MNVISAITPMLKELEGCLYQASGNLCNVMPQVGSQFGIIGSTINNIRVMLEAEEIRAILGGHSPTCKAVNAIRATNGLPPLDLSITIPSIGTSDIPACSDEGRDTLRPYIETFRHYLENGGVFNFKEHGYDNLDHTTNPHTLSVKRTASHGAVVEEYRLRLQVAHYQVEHFIHPQWEDVAAIMLNKENVILDTIMDEIVKPVMEFCNLELLQPVACSQIEKLFVDTFTQDELDSIGNQYIEFPLVLKEAEDRRLDKTIIVKVKSTYEQYDSVRLLNFSSRTSLDYITSTVDTGVSKSSYNDIKWESITYPLQQRILELLPEQLALYKATLVEGPPNAS